MDLKKIALFTDISLNSKEKIGFGSFLIVPESDMENITKTLELVKRNVRLKRFESGSSTELEIETLLWALEELMKNNKQVDLNLSIYTDSQCIVGLPERRIKLENSEFMSLRKNKKLNNAVLYHKFYKYQDKLQFKLFKIKGHSRLRTKDLLHKIFTLVDKASRKALRTYLEKKKIH